MGKVRKRVIDDDTSKGEGNYNAMHDKYSDGTTEQLAYNIIVENMMSQI